MSQGSGEGRAEEGRADLNMVHDLITLFKSSSNHSRTPTLLTVCACTNGVSDSGDQWPLGQLGDTVAQRESY